MPEETFVKPLMEAYHKGYQDALEESKGIMPEETFVKPLMEAYHKGYQDALEEAQAAFDNRPLGSVSAYYLWLENKLSAARKKEIHTLTFLELKEANRVLSSIRRHSKP
jgi:hypothetical protein